jgi:xanthine dehydrogenase accessory factor
VRDFYDRVTELLAEHVSFVVATIVKVGGSSPRDVGAKLIVFCDGTTEGTLGGGKLEAQVVRDALERLGLRSIATKSYWLSEEGLGMKCGGTVEVYFEPITPAARLVIFGGGHVGRAIARLAPTAGFDVEVVDDRAEHLDAGAYPPAVRLRPTGPAFRDGFEPLSSEDYAVIVTRDAATDAALAGLHAPICAYVGVMGSQAKRAFMERTVTAAGVPKEAFDRVRCPMGVDIGADTPDEIAVSVVAELIAFRASRRSSVAQEGSRTPARQSLAAAKKKRAVR